MSDEKIVRARLGKKDGCVLKISFSSFDECEVDMGFSIEGVPGDRLTRVTTRNQVSAKIEGVADRVTVLEAGTELQIDKLDTDLSYALLEALSEQHCIAED